MQKTKPTGKYSVHRTARGNVQVGRLGHKSNFRIAKDAQNWKNLHQSRFAMHKAEAMGKLALLHERRKLG
jgi:hypothetical protein